ncbi:hypothetical protein T11_12999 [Trichinella zimbabwensis]|uniref:Uncharacterized protein n=1 Tax=Trichinella zimbabwensis TaxID=268475 RepID=A0A0V1HBU2_9BILA|nr:hypothetical protein T11_12999 [Trichinella zimbabwensis]
MSINSSCTANFTFDQVVGLVVANKVSLSLHNFWKMLYLSSGKYRFKIITSTSIVCKGQRILYANVKH